MARMLLPDGVRALVRDELHESEVIITYHYWLEEELGRTRAQIFATPRPYFQVLFSMCEELILNDRVANQTPTLFGYLTDIGLVPLDFVGQRDMPIFEQIELNLMNQVFRTNLTYYHKLLPRKKDHKENLVGFPKTYLIHLPEYVRTAKTDVEFRATDVLEMVEIPMPIAYRLLRDSVRQYRGDVHVDGNGQPQEPAEPNAQRQFHTRLAFELIVGSTFKRHLATTLPRVTEAAQAEIEAKNVVLTRTLLNPHLPRNRTYNIVNNVLWTMVGGGNEFDHLNVRFREYLVLLGVFPQEWGNLERPAFIDPAYGAFCDMLLGGFPSPTPSVALKEFLYLNVTIGNRLGQVTHRWLFGVMLRDMKIYATCTEDPALARPENGTQFQFEATTGANVAHNKLIWLIVMDNAIRNFLRQE